jgi:hypothetical protein
MPICIIVGGVLVTKVSTAAICCLCVSATSCACGYKMKQNQNQTNGPVRQRMEQNHQGSQMYPNVPPQQPQYLQPPQQPQIQYQYPPSRTY